MENEQFLPHHQDCGFFILLTLLSCCCFCFVQCQIPTSPPPFETHWYNQTLDHFQFTKKASTLWPQRYLVSTKYFDPNAKQPAIFFYTGNEGDIEMFWQNTGAIYVLAQQHCGLVVFGEHRYYGQSLPFGRGSLLQPEYLSSEQAIADYVKLLLAIKNPLSPNYIEGAENLPVVALGGSYGGELAAWIRMKAPNVVIGSLASSAPILGFPGLSDQYAYNNIIADDYTQAGGDRCSSSIRNTFPLLEKLTSTPQGRSTIEKAMHLCQPLPSQAKVGYDQLFSWLSNAFSYTAMTNYPDATSFLQPLPAWPVNVTCNQINDALPSSGSPTDAQLLNAIRRGVSVYYNSTGNESCFNITQSVSAGLGMGAWDIQACSEQVFEISSGQRSLFPPQQWNLSNLEKECALIGITTRPNYSTRFYQSDAIVAAIKSGQTIDWMSQIIFSQGALDPWSGLGVGQDLSPSLYGIMIEHAAHHLDLRFASPNDPPSVSAARKKEHDIISGWIHDFYQYQE